MKKLFFIAGMILATGILYGQSLQKGNLVGFHIIDLKLKPGVTEDQATKFVLDKMIPAEDKAFKIKCYLMRGIRGESTGKLAYLMVFKDENDRNQYYGDDDNTTEAYEKANALMKDINDEAATLWETTDLEDVYDDYLVVVSKGEPIHKGSLVGVHNLALKLNENATEEQFIDYHSKYLEAAYENFDPNIKVSVVKSLRGTHPAKLAYFVIYENEEARNLYFDKDNKATQKQLDLEKAVKAQTDELSKTIGTMERTYTDWIVL